jgi:hypothetical protein
MPMTELLSNVNIIPWQSPERKSFDEMWDIPRLYITACSNSVQLVPLHPIIISVLFHHYNELIQCTSEVEQMRAKVNNSKKKGLTKKEGKEEESPIQSKLFDF